MFELMRQRHPFEDLIRDAFDDDDFIKKELSMKRPQMLADVSDLGDAYQIEIDLPGYKKEDIAVELEDEVLRVSVSKDESSEKKDKNGKVILCERHSGRSDRGFYVGKEIKPDEIRAKFQDGVLQLIVPKKEPVSAQKKQIAISE